MKKYRKRIPYWGRVGIACLAALALVFLALIAAHLMGFRYYTVERLDGTKISFAGKTDGNGGLIYGKIFYADSSYAIVDEKSGEISYSNGSVYKGKLSDVFERTGEGTLTLKNGDTYTGGFSCDMLNGHGVYRFANGDVYEGDFVNNVKQGNGKFTFADGESYEGGFYADMRHGNGKVVFTDGSSYEGGFEQGLKWGKGVYLYPNGDKYEGDFEYDMRHGEGTYTWANGECYTGSFENNNINGYGTYTWPEGRKVYTGYFKNGEIVLVDPTAGNTDNPETQKVSD